MHLSPEQQRILILLQQGSRLQVHRSLDGEKIYRLHEPDGPGAEVIAPGVAASLEQQGLVESNMKFPAATFLLTGEGARLASELTGSTRTPTGPRNYR